MLLFVFVLVVCAGCLCLCFYLCLLFAVGAWAGECCLFHICVALIGFSACRYFTFHLCQYFRQCMCGLMIFASYAKYCKNFSKAQIKYCLALGDPQWGYWGFFSPSISVSLPRPLIVINNPPSNVYWKIPYTIFCEVFIFHQIYIRPPTLPTSPPTYSPQ